MSNLASPRGNERIKTCAIYTRFYIAVNTKAKDTLMTIIETAKKLGVNTFKYIYDRISGKYAMASLADLIRQHSSVPAAG